MDCEAARLNVRLCAWEGWAGGGAYRGDAAGVCPSSRRPAPNAATAAAAPDAALTTEQFF